MLLSTNRHVGLDLQAELDDARAEIQDLRAEKAALQHSLTEQRSVWLAVKRDTDAVRARYEEQTAELKRIGMLLEKMHMFNEQLRKERDAFKNEIDAWQQKYRNSVAKAHPEYVNQQVAQTNPYAIA